MSDERLDILLVGSSIFEQWPDPAAAAPGRSLRNAAIGGTQTADWLDRLAPALEAHRPREVWCYVGSNDFANGVVADVIERNVVRLAAMVESAGAGFVYFAVMKCPAKRPIWPTIDAYHARLARQLSRPIVDLNAAVEGQRGMYQIDGVHLHGAAYDRIAEVTRAAMATPDSRGQPD